MKYLKPYNKINESLFMNKVSPKLWDDAYLVSEETAGDLYVTYKLFKLPNDEYFITVNNEIIQSVEFYKRNLDKTLNKTFKKGEDWEQILAIAFNKLLEPLQTYEFQKNYITKHQDRINELKIVGFNEKIKEEFADLIEGGEFGFFGLKN